MYKLPCPDELKVLLYLGGELKYQDIHFRWWQSFAEGSYVRPRAYRDGVLGPLAPVAALNVVPSLAVADLPGDVMDVDNFELPEMDSEEESTNDG